MASSTVRESGAGPTREPRKRRSSPSPSVPALANDEPGSVYARMLEAGSAPRTAGNVHRVLHSGLQAAVEEKIIAANLAAKAKPPRPPKSPMRTLTADQSRALVRAAEGHRYEAVIVLALHTGMRKGELFGLRWADVDLRSASLMVQGSLQPIPGKGLQIVEVKTDSSRRRISLGEPATSALRRHRARQAEERLRLGAEWRDQDLVFPNTRGTPTHPGNFQRREFVPLMAKGTAQRRGSDSEVPRSAPHLRDPVARRRCTSEDR